MAIIVDKVQKKRDIALSCKDLFVSKGINDLTISEVAKTAGVGKGTIYEYFSNKEEIVFEIVNLLMQEHNIKKEKKMQENIRTKEKIKAFSDFFYAEDEKELRAIYKEFISISLLNPKSPLLEFQSSCSDKYFSWFQEIIQEGIDKKELIPNSMQFARGLFVLGEGIFVSSEITNRVSDVKEELDTFIDALFELIEVKK